MRSTPMDARSLHSVPQVHSYSPPSRRTRYHEYEPPPPFNLDLSPRPPEPPSTSAAALRRRSALPSSDAVEAVTKLWWSTALKCAGCEDKSLLPHDAFISIHRVCLKALFEVWDANGAGEQAESEWTAVSQPGATAIEQDAFVDALFRLADVWADAPLSLGADVHVAFLHDLYKHVTRGGVWVSEAKVKFARYQFGDFIGKGGGEGGSIASGRVFLPAAATVDDDDEPDRQLSPPPSRPQPDSRRPSIDVTIRAPSPSAAAVQRRSTGGGGNGAGARAWRRAVR